MTTPINIPKLGVAMTEGVLVEWLVDDGSEVVAGQPIYLLETDKVENEVEAPTSGVIRILADEGDTYGVGTSVGEIA